MKIALIHPLRHHSYYSLKGIDNTNHDVIGLYGFYKKNDFLDKLVCKMNYSKLLDGYNNDEIANKIKTNIGIKFLFLLYKKYPNTFQNIYFFFFERWCIRNLKGVDCIHVLQDYCNSVIRYAHKKGIKIIYEQIQPFDNEQKRILEDEIIKWNYTTEYIEGRFPNKKIDMQLENIHMAEKIICASEVSFNSLLPYVEDRQKIYTFPYGVYNNKFEWNEIMKYKDFEKERLNILYVGNFGLIKGVQYIVEVAKKLINYNIHFNFIGKPTNNQDKVLIEEILKLENCTYKESIPHIEIGDEYLKNDIFIFQGLCEGFGMVTLEAMSYGLPCIVSKGGKGVIENEVTGFINDNGDVESIIKNIKLLYKNRDILSEMSKNSFDSSKKYTWNVFSNKIYEIYKQL